jgi:hypothetical protein
MKGSHGQLKRLVRHLDAQTLSPNYIDVRRPLIDEDDVVTGFSDIGCY